VIAAAMEKPSWEEIMKRVATLVILIGILVGGSVFAFRLVRTPKVQAQNSCTNANFQGAFGYTFTGLTGFNALPFASVGRLVADGQGNLAGAETDSSNGKIFQRTYAGTYNVNSDCTGSEVTLDNFGKTVKCNFVIVAGGREIQAIETDNNTAVVGCLKHQLGQTPRGSAELPQ
jgi:hypothetical protein